MLTGFMARQGGGAQAQAMPPAGGGLEGMLSGLLGGRQGGGGLGSMLNMNCDANALDDILRLAGKSMR